MCSPIEHRPSKNILGLRWIICSLLFFSVGINYVDRNAISILKIPLSHELGWTLSNYGHVIASFQLAYAFGYLLGGRFMDVIGVRVGFPLIVLAWSLASAAHGLCVFIPVDSKIGINLGAWSFTVPGTVLGFIAARVALGLAEGGNFPAAIKIVAEWFPIKERALATGLFNAGTNIGAIFCLTSLPYLYKWLSWPTIFYLTGVLGILWVVAWIILYKPPEHHPWITLQELNYVLSGRSSEDPKPTRVSWLSLLKYRPVWAAIITGCLAGPVWNIYQFFLPDFLKRQFDVSLEQNGWLNGLFYLIASFGGVWAGWLAGQLMKRNYSLNAARKLTLLTCALAITPLFLAPVAPSPLLATIICGIAGSAHQGWSANTYTFISDTMPRSVVGAIVGLSGFTAYFSGAIMSEAIPLVVERTGSYFPVFLWGSMMYLVSLGILHILVPHIEPQKLNNH